MALMVSRAMMRLPMAACSATSNICRGISLRSRFDEFAPALVGLSRWHDQRERVHRLAADQHVELHQVAIRDSPAR